MTSESVFEDGAINVIGAADALTSDDISVMNEMERKQILLGMDFEEAEEMEAEKKNMSDLQKEALREYQDIANEEAKGVLDFSYYHIGNNGLAALLPTLENEYLLSIKTLDLSYNSLSGNGVDELIQTLA